MQRREKRLFPHPVANRAHHDPVKIPCQPRCDGDLHVLLTRLAPLLLALAFGEFLR
jgi:hypothetical protein